MDDVCFRSIRDSETRLLPDFLLLAIQTPGHALPPREVLEDVDLAQYYVGFDPNTVHGDVAVCAVHDGKVTGIAWSRILDAEPHGYGYVGQGIPEVGWAILPDYRNQGIGTKLIQNLLEAIDEQGFRQVSLSVLKTNPASRLYRRIGFQPESETDDEYVMTIDLTRFVRGIV